MSNPVMVTFTVQAAANPQPSAELVQLIASLMENYAGKMRPEDRLAVVAWFSTTYGKPSSNEPR